MKVHHAVASGLIGMLAVACATPPPAGQDPASTPPPAPVAAAAVAKPPAPAAADSLQVLFDFDSATLSASGNDVIDHAARLFREGNPVVMTVAGHSDGAGEELPNLILSARRAATVKEALVARGIPGQRLELVALGVAEPAVPTNPTAPENRRVVITWR
jgi:outer membrane protein OmpA-like peptidoglycan-associated protein